MKYRRFNERALSIKVFLIVGIVLIFGLQSLGNADEITEFEIENMSIGEVQETILNICSLLHPLELHLVVQQLLIQMV